MEAYDKTTRLEQHITKLRRLRNSMLLYTRLLPDILPDYIFPLCVPSLSDIPSSPSWLAFSQVCFAWRSAALANTSLWNRADLSLLDLARLLVGRSHQSPLALRVLSHKGPSEFLPERYRIRTLVLGLSIADFASDAALGEAMSSFLDGQFPALESLILEGSRPSYVWDVGAMTMPRLQSLEFFESVLKDWSVLARTNIKSLALSFMGTNSSKLPLTILDVLKHCPELVSLRFCGHEAALRPPEDAVTSAMPKLQLSCLQHLQLHEQWSVLSRLSHHLELPALVDIDISFVVDRSDALHPHEFASIMDVFVHNTSCAPLRHVEFVVGTSTVTVRGWANTPRSSTIEKSPFKLSFAGSPSQDANFLPQVARLIRLLPLQDVVKLELDIHRLNASVGPQNMGHAIRTALCAVASSLPALEDLKLRGSMRDPCFELMMSTLR